LSLADHLPDVKKFCFFSLVRIFRLFKWDVTFSAVSRSLSAGVFDLGVTRRGLGAGSKGAPESLIVPLLAIDFIGARASCP
jgi:hypothetical protein